MPVEQVKIEAVTKMRALMRRHYMDAKKAVGTDTKVAWVTSGAPVELCHAFGILPVYPENHAALCGAGRIATTLSDAAEERGFSRDLCVYARIDFGQVFTGKSPIGGLPKPDLLICCNNICATVTKWYVELQRHFDVPLVFIDAPFVYDGMTDESIDYVAAQIEGAMHQVGKIVNKPVDLERLEEVNAMSMRAAELWQEILALSKNKPAPMNVFDAFIHMAPVVVGRGTQECIDYYELLRAEIAGRVEQGIASVPKERFRLGWDNIAVWYKIKDLFQRFAGNEASLVVSTYTTSFGKSYIVARDIEDTFRRMAAAYLPSYINSGFDARKRELIKMVEDYSLDGVVMHSNRSCKPYSVGMYDLAKSLVQDHDIPVVVFETDHCDQRHWSDEQIYTRLDAFMETLDARKG